MITGLCFQSWKAFLFLLAATICSLSCTNDRHIESDLPGHPFLKKLAEGDSLMDAGLFAAAFRTYDTLVRASPDSNQLNMRLLRVYLAVGLHDRADTLLKQMMAEDTGHREPGYWEGFLSMFSISKGDTLSLRKQTGSLLSAASEAKPDLYEAVAFNEVFLREFDLAIQHYERWVSLAKPEVPPTEPWLPLPEIRQAK